MQSNKPHSSTSLEQSEREAKEHTMRRFNMSEADWVKEKQAFSQTLGREVSDSELSEALELGFT